MVCQLCFFFILVHFANVYVLSDLAFILLEIPTVGFSIWIFYRFFCTFNFLSVGLDPLPLFLR